MVSEHKQQAEPFIDSEGREPKRSVMDLPQAVNDSNKNSPFGWFGSPWRKNLIAFVLAVACSLLLHRFSPAIAQSGHWQRITMAIIMWLEWFLFWWFLGFLATNLHRIRVDRKALKNLRKRWSKNCRTIEDDQGLLPRRNIQRLLDHCLADDQRLPFGLQGKKIFISLLRDFAKGKGHLLLEERITRASDSARYKQNRWLAQMRLIPLSHVGVASIKYTSGEPPGMFALTLMLAGLVIFGAHWLANKESQFEHRWFSFLHDKCLAMLKMVDPGIEQLTQELVETREQMSLSLQQLMQVNRANYDQNQRLFLQLCRWQEDTEKRHCINDRRSSEWMQTWERGQARQLLQIEALGGIIERELGAGTLQETIQHMQTVTGTFVTQLDRMLHQLHEKMIVGSENLRATADSLRLYVEQGGVADTALLHKSLNDFRQVVQELTAGFQRVEAFTERLADLPQAVEGMTQAGTALFQSGNMAQRIVKSFSALRQQFADFGEAISQQVGRQNSLQTEATEVLAKTNQVMTSLQTTMNAVEESLGETGNEIAAIQNIMERMALRSGF